MLSALLKRFSENHFVSHSLNDSSNFLNNTFQPPEIAPSKLKHETSLVPQAQFTHIIAGQYIMGPFFTGSGSRKLSAHMQKVFATRQEGIEGISTVLLFIVYIKTNYKVSR